MFAGASENLVKKRKFAKNGSIFLSPTQHDMAELVLNKDVFPHKLKVALHDGDHHAYRSVYLHLWGPVKAFILRQVGSEEIAKDMTQNIFITLWEKRESIDPSKNIKSYLYVIARNAIIKHFNHQEVYEKYAERQGRQASEEYAADTLLISKELELYTDLIVSRMPKVQQRVFELSTKEGLAPEQIAEMLGINKTSVATHLSRARKELKQVLQELLVLLLWFI